ncbi:MAG TPA: phosphoglycerate dehydrogenase [Bacteroidia bacterium]|nr:phosphoglycerate dehydrogenase [Bacteroidia bacterium]HNT79718.1 phosphoglycerate dehydrogenase [Bacteroidia bacterium]
MKKTSFPKDKIKILLLEGIHQSAVKMLKQHGYTNVESLPNTFAEDDLIKKIKNVHILGTRSKTKLTAKIFENAPKLLTSSCFCAGTNQVDLIAATKNGIAVFNAPFSNTRSVAELVIGHTISLMRYVPEKNKGAHEGKWLKDSKYAREVRGKYLGIVGYGHIGTQVSIMAEALGMKVIFYDIDKKLSLGNATQVDSLEELIKLSDIITLHVPGGEANKNLFNEKRLKAMKKGAFLINVCRGDVVDLVAAKKLLESKHLGGLALDVYTVEPVKKEDRFECVLQGVDNVILTPHIGGSTVEAQENIGIDVASKIINFIETGSSASCLSIPSLTLPVMNHTTRILHIHQNVPGVLSEINNTLSKNKVNILGQYLKTNNHVGYVVLDINKTNEKGIVEKLKNIKHTIRVRNLY